MNLALCCGAIWRHRDKPQYRCTTTLSPVHNCEKIFWKITSYMTFGAHKLVRSEPFFDSRCEIWQLLPGRRRYVANCGEKLHRCTSTFHDLKYCCGFFKSLTYLYEGKGAHLLFRRFLNFSQFWPQFPKIVAPSSNKNENYLAHLKGQSLLKKTLKTASKSTQNSDTKPAQIIPPRTNSAPASERDKKTDGHTNTIFSHLQPARVVRSSPKLCMVIELVVPIKKVPSIFWANV